MKKRIVAVLLTTVLLCGCFMINSEAKSVNLDSLTVPGDSDLSLIIDLTGGSEDSSKSEIKIDDNSTETDSKILDLINDKIKVMEQEYYEMDCTNSNLEVISVDSSITGIRSSLTSNSVPASYKRTVKTIKNVQDFSGSLYTVAELSPSGYIIYHNDSGLFVEYTLTGDSPFASYTDTSSLIYGGPNSYFRKSGSVVYDLISSSKLSSSELKTAKNTSKNNTEYYLNCKDDVALEYAKGSATILPSQADILYSNLNGTNYQLRGFTMVNRSNLFTELIQCGASAGGTCGYNAAAILLYYKTVSGSCPGALGNLDYYYSISDNGYKIKNTVSRRLINIGASLGYGNGTGGYIIRRVVTTWLNNKGITNVTHVNKTSPWTGISVIKQQINNNNPVIYFGTEGNVEQHAVVVYGYKDIGRLLSGTYVAHFGTDGMRSVSFTGYANSIYYFY